MKKEYFKDFVAGVIDGLAQQAHQNAVEHGWWEQERSVGEIIALMHSELSEALEYARKNPNAPSDHIPNFTGIEEELADVIIRIFDYAGKEKLRLGEAIFEKMKYNKTRPYKHGNKKF